MKRAAITIALLGAARVAAADPAPDIEIPSLILDTPDDKGAAEDSQLELANIVQSAAKGVTTVQEAPAIVTVITADEIRDRQFVTLGDLYDDVPGWQSGSIYNNALPVPVVRGQAQAVQYLVDGLSMFDPFVNAPAANRVFPMELIKRVELITGPGGVLWGSNSLLGILNVITKDAEDLDGVEIGGQLGDGTGDRLDARAYVMAGKSDLLGGKLKLFGHASVDTFQGPGYKDPLVVFHEPPPQPNGASIYGPLTEGDPVQSYVVTFDGKATIGKLQLRVSAPFGRMNEALGFNGNPVRSTLPQDSTCDKTPTDPSCADPNHVARTSRLDDYDRYAVAEYRTRFDNDHAGLTVKVYGEQFHRTFDPLQVLTPSPGLEGGLNFAVDLTSYRSGGAIDGDLEIGRTLRVLYGAEGFHEWKPINTGAAELEGGTQATLTAPYNPALLPLLCPREYNPSTMAVAPVADCPLTFAFPADRTVFGAYLDPQWRPTKELIFDLGGRLQYSPSALGNLSYPVNTTVAASAVWNFIPNWHLKLNYAQGFRPPVFNDTVGNATAVEFGGSPTLKVETSDALQAEINARLYKGERRIRELSFRIDGSYTRLQNLIQVQSSTYENSGERAISSIEFLANLYIQGGHRLEFGYTWLKIDTSDIGAMITIPQNTFSLTGVWNLVTGKLTGTTNLKVTGSTDDVNRLVEYRGSSLDAAGNVINPITVASTDLVVDRLPPIAALTLGLTYMPTPKLSIRATVYDALYGHFYQPDVFADYSPRLEYLPSPYQGFRAYVTALYQF